MICDRDSRDEWDEGVRKLRDSGVTKADLLNLLGLADYEDLVSEVKHRYNLRLEDFADGIVKVVEAGRVEA